MPPDVRKGFALPELSILLGLRPDIARLGRSPNFN
jgi:hypothetical protein